jgi:hypothetical protein
MPAKSKSLVNKEDLKWKETMIENYKLLLSRIETVENKVDKINGRMGL